MPRKYHRGPDYSVVRKVTNNYGDVLMVNSVLAIKTLNEINRKKLKQK